MASFYKVLLYFYKFTKYFLVPLLLSLVYFDDFLKNHISICHVTVSFSFTTQICFLFPSFGNKRILFGTYYKNDNVTSIDVVVKLFSRTNKQTLNEFLDIQKNFSPQIGDGLTLCSKVRATPFLALGAKNLETTLLKILKKSDGWPTPGLISSCEDTLVEEYVGPTLAYYPMDSFYTKLRLALSVLNMAHAFTFKHAEYRFYMTDLTVDNIAVNNDLMAILIDLDHVIVQKKSDVSEGSVHVTLPSSSDNELVFSTQEICQHSVSDINFFQVCQQILRRCTVLGQGLLERVPSDISDEFPELERLVDECARPLVSNHRIEAAYRLIDFIKKILHLKQVGKDGVILLNDDYLLDRKIFGQVVCSFRYGREEDEVMGLNFQKDLFLASEQIYPQEKKNENLTKLQERLIKKLGPNAYPFTFTLPTSAPASVTLQQDKEDNGEPCGIQFFVKIFAGESETDRTHRRSTVALGIRKIQFAPSKQGRQPCTIVRKDFLMSPGELELEVTLDKQLYHHQEKIAVNICIRNNSNKVVKKIKAMVQQGVDVVLFQNGQYRTSVASIETQEGCPIQPGSSLQKVMYLVPTLESNKDRRGIALDGQLKRQDTNLASSTLLASPDSRDAFGIIISYSVKVKLYLGALGGELSAELPLVLMHPKPTNQAITMKADSQADMETWKNETIDAE